MIIALTNVKYDHIAKVTLLFNVFFIPILENNQWSYQTFVTDNDDITFNLKLDDGVVTHDMVQTFLAELTETLRK